jgi:hypothetical protein
VRVALDGVDGVDEMDAGGGPGRYFFSTLFAITTRWISLVPS